MQALGVDVLGPAATRQGHQLPNTHRQLRTGEVRNVFARWDRRGKKRSLTVSYYWLKLRHWHWAKFAAISLRSGW
jgi:hypothetical protein